MQLFFGESHEPASSQVRFRQLVDIVTPIRQDGGVELVDDKFIHSIGMESHKSLHCTLNYIRVTAHKPVEPIPKNIQ